ncbi:MAG: hypothetical protein ACI837_002958 [Crocinitomicaceae bacterium]|jgi:hypothetical protein
MRANEYLKYNSTVREELINLRLFYELKRAAAEREYHLKIFDTNVDFEGFDIIIDDNRLTGKYQIKTTWNSKVTKWKIHRNMLFPTSREGEKMRVGDGLVCSNVEKGIILLNVQEIDKEIKLDYFFTNFYIIKAISHGLIKRRKPTYKLANSKMNELLGKNGRPNEKIKINKGLFVNLKDAMSLLAICGFDNTLNIRPKLRLLELFEENKINRKDIEKTQLYDSNANMFEFEMKQILAK